MKQIIIPYDEYLKLSKNINNVKNLDSLYNRINRSLSYINERIYILRQITDADSKQVIEWFDSLSHIINSALETLKIIENEDE